MINWAKCNITNNSHAVCNERMELRENQIKLLEEEFNFKTKMINSLQEKLVSYESYKTILHRNGLTAITPNEADDSHQLPK